MCGFFSGNSHLHCKTTQLVSVRKTFVCQIGKHYFVNENDRKDVDYIKKHMKLIEYTSLIPPPPQKKILSKNDK
jgi:hypothetical protein